MTLLKPLVPLACMAILGACATALTPDKSSVTRGKTIFAKECSACHGANGDGAGSASLGLGMTPPDLTGLTARNDGAFPRAFVQRFVLGQIEKEDPDAAMPEFGTVGLQHAAKDGAPAGEVTAEDMIALLDYIETIQK
ncbi:cytochrome c [uncultured Sulfitobacter sp.]|uniref:c-type cytochrome n=1 Tax=uncultured Sulfitobacter sp. TaxID=191468 RepID=UPI002606FB1C|nr:cytochrome c [uncultured Sulfitobacter sp.]